MLGGWPGPALVSSDSNVNSDTLFGGLTAEALVD